MIVNILVADDHEIFRKGVKKILKKMNDKAKPSVSRGQKAMDLIKQDSRAAER